jgi:rubrerythrin
MNPSEKPCHETTETIISILEEAIESEVESEEKYLHGAELACDPSVRDFFLSLARMEHDHKDQLTKQLAELRAQMKIVEEMNDMFY